MWILWSWTESFPTMNACVMFLSCAFSNVWSDLISDRFPLSCCTDEVSLQCASSYISWESHEQVLKAFLYSGHLCFSLEWILWCMVRQQFCLKSFPQSLHFSPVYFPCMHYNVGHIRLDFPTVTTYIGFLYSGDFLMISNGWATQATFLIDLSSCGMLTFLLTFLWL